MKRLHRFTGLLLALALVLGLFSGCGASRDISATEPTSAQERPGATQLGNWAPGENLVPVTNRAPEDPKTKPYTILVYMVGSDLESKGGFASSDIMEMLDSGLKGSNANLVLYTGGSVSWDLDIPSDVNTVFALNEAGDTLEVVGNTSQSMNMGDPNTLLDFLNFAYRNFPAEKYGLICWDHGGGPLYGFGSDELFDHDGLDLWELEQALKASPFGQTKLEFVGFDACLMGTIEVADTLSEYASYLVASEDVEPGNGWNYKFLGTLNETSDTLTLAESILSSYRTSMEENFWKPEYTLSCIDLAQVPGLIGSLDRLFGQMYEQVVAGSYSQIARSRDNTKRFGVSAVSDRGSSFDLVDLGDMAAKLGGDYETQTAQVLASLEAAVLGQVTNMEGPTGLAMYYPYDNKSLYRAGGSLYEYGEMSGEYQRFLNVFTQRWLSGERSFRWDTTQAIGEEEEFLTLQLEPEQLENLGSVTYTVLRYEETENAYCPLLTDFQVQPDENGLVKIPRNPDVILMRTDTDELTGALWPVSLTESTAARNRYVSPNATLLATRDVIIGDSEPIQITLSSDLATGEVTIQSILSRNWADGEFYGRQDVDLDNWGVVAYTWEPLYPTYDVEGELLPWNEWESDGSYFLTYCNYEDSFSMDKSQLKEQEGEFYCQVVLKDSSGNVIGTRLEELYTNTPYTDQVVTVAEGTMTFRLYDDHAVLKSFASNGGNEYPYAGYTVTVPANVGGLPVTAIGEQAFRACLDVQKVILPQTLQEIRYSAFASCYNLTEVTLPDSLRSIGSGAFSFTDLAALELPEGLERLDYQCFMGTNLETITLPASLKAVGGGAFAWCKELKQILVAEGNPVYKSVDGVLFTADGTKLVAFPGAWGEKYDVPAGTRVIGDEAFRGNDILTTLNFNDGLEIIDRLAFCDTVGLLYLDLPESLQTIGHGAFACSVGVHPAVEIPEVTLGTKVSFVGAEAFSGYKVKAFTVAEGNETYAAGNGCLLNASGTRLIQAPYGCEGELVIPDGVSYLAWRSLDGCNEITSLVFPDSLVAVNHAAGIPVNLQKLTVGKGLKDWQNVEIFFTVPEIILHPENPYYVMTKDGSIYSADMTTLYLCRSEEAEFVIPEGVTTLETGALQSLAGDAATMRTIVFPASLVNLPENPFFYMTALEEIRVAEGNPRYASYDGLLYTKDGKTLLACPLGRTGTVSVREGTLEIGDRAFYYGGNLMASEIIIPEGVTAVRYGNFTAVPYNGRLMLHLPGSLTDIHEDIFRFVEPENAIIFCPTGSAIEAMAREKGLSVIPE